jgi:hypothetical protein
VPDCQLFWWIGLANVRKTQERADERQERMTKAADERQERISKATDERQERIAKSAKDSEREDKQSDMRREAVSDFIAETLGVVRQHTSHDPVEVDLQKVDRAPARVLVTCGLAVRVAADELVDAVQQWIDETDDSWDPVEKALKNIADKINEIPGGGGPAAS